MKLTSSFVLLVLLTAGGCSKQQGAGGFSMPPMPAEVVEVSMQTVTDRFDAVGTIEAMDAVTVVAEMDALVKSLPFREGETIKRGEIIAQLEDGQLAAEVLRAEALRAQSKSTYDRVKAIVDLGAAAPQDLDDALAALNVADANLAVAKARFSKTRVVAPFDGIIGARRVSTGTFLRPGQPVADLANMDAIRVTFSAPERFLSRLSRGATIDVSAPAFPGITLTGKIIAIEPVLDAATRSARIVARVDNPGQRFRSGMSANVSAVLGQRPEAMTIPNEAVFGTGDRSFVFIVKEDSSVARVALTLGTRLPEMVEVLDGLTPGMRVVRAGHQKLFDGAKVMPMMSMEGDSTKQMGT